MADKRRDKEGRILPENVIQRKDGTYMWKKSINGVQYCEYARTLGEIKQKRNKALGEIEAGTYQGKLEKMRKAKILAEKDITLNEWFFQWEKAYRIGRLKDSTVQTNHRMYMNYFSDNLGRMKVKDISSLNVVEVVNKMHEDGLKKNTIANGVKVLKIMFKDALQNGLTSGNPAMGALHNIKDDNKEKRILTEDEEKIFFDYIESHGWFKDTVPLFTFGFNTGMRIGEILALTWPDIDFENNAIHVTKSLYVYNDVFEKNKKRVFIGNPKTETSIRDVPMLPQVKKALVEQKKIQHKSKVIIDGYTDFVFTTRTGNVLSVQDINKRLKTIAKGINKEEEQRSRNESREPVYFEPFSSHSMRHTFTTRCYEKGVRVKVIQKILGHKNPDMTLEVYTHTTDSMVQEDLKKIEQK